MRGYVKKGCDGASSGFLVGGGLPVDIIIIVIDFLSAFCLI
jgi:hypothetical protein